MYLVQDINSLNMSRQFKNSPPMIALQRNLQQSPMNLHGNLYDDTDGGIDLVSFVS